MIPKKSFQQVGLLLEALIPELFEYSQSDQWF
jgi:hypothetical protein